MVMQIILPLTYEDVFQNSSKKTPLEFISGYAKVGLLKKLAFLGEKTQEYTKKNHENPIKANSEFLDLFVIPEIVKQKILSILNTKNGALHAIFTRETILWAIEIIVNSDFDSNDLDLEVTNEFTYRMFSFLLSINSKYLNTSLDKMSSVDDINASLIMANSFYENEAILTPFKGVRLFEYLSKSQKYSELLKEYIESKYKVSYQKYIRCILRWGEVICKHSVNPVF